MLNKEGQAQKKRNAHSVHVQVHQSGEQEEKRSPFSTVRHDIAFLTLCLLYLSMAIFQVIVPYFWSSVLFTLLTTTTTTFFSPVPHGNHLLRGARALRS